MNVYYVRQENEKSSSKGALFFVSKNNKTALELVKEHLEDGYDAEILLTMVEYFKNKDSYFVKITINYDGCEFYEPGSDEYYIYNFKKLVENQVYPYWGEDGLSCYSNFEELSKHHSGIIIEED